MTLDTGTILTAVFFVLLCTIPFILMNISHRKKVKQNLYILNREAAKYNLNLTRFNTWGNTSIGMDAQAGAVLFTKKTADGEITQQVILGNTAKCRVADIKRTQSDGDHHYSITERLDLVFETRDKKETAFSFFDIQHDGGMLTGELQMAEKWCTQVNSFIRTS